MTAPPLGQVQWQLADVTSPHLDRRISVVAAKDIPYLPRSNRFQTLSLYLPDTPETAALVGTPPSALPIAGMASAAPRCHVHIHGGAWRDPYLTASSIEPTVAHAFADTQSPIEVIASINYRISQFPTHAALPYDAIRDNHSDAAREAVHPEHLRDVLHAFALLRSYGLADRSYILSGHSCGACLAFQAIFQAPRTYGLENISDAPCPAAMLGLNGLYDLVELVYGLGASHEHLGGDYEMFLSNAFGGDKSKWPTASPAHFDPATMAKRIQDSKAPRLVVLDESAEDQLVPMNQLERLEANLGNVEGLQLARGHRCTGSHAAPWEQGVMIWNSLRDVLDLLQKRDG